MIQTTRVSAWRRSFLLAAALLLILSALAACGKKDSSSGAGSDTVIATYKGGQVTEGEFKKYTTFYSMFDPSFTMYMSIPKAKEQYLREYVGYKVLYDRANEEDKKQAETDMDLFMDQYDLALKDENLKKAVEEADLKTEDVKGFYQMIVTIRKYWERNTSDEEMKLEYDNNKPSYNLVSVRHILIGTVDPMTGEEKRKEEEALKIAQEVKAKLDAGGDWTELAKQYSEDDGSKDNGGLYENVNPNQWVEAFKQAALTQPVGQVGEPVLSEYGYHVMKVEKRDDMQYEEISEDTRLQVKNGAINTKMSEFMTNEMSSIIESINLPKAEESATEEGTAAEDAVSSDEAKDDAATDEAAKDNAAESSK
ncbi:peptidylprolyl isomerase [Paenibacillus xylaniclasticus]|uniref:peptidylprolyl isomerase n=1 Tax=Paenibacillus xylaniclasticus TaxID=588083 RepID=UPI000FD77B62|nr:MULTISPECIES: peptidylprolyl isomerase [Paenibacillus]GFN33761.1 foldase protein PrsA [Paenibacillus curdlanolyticus]